MKKKVDGRIGTLISNGVKLRHRSMFVVVGDSSRDQVVVLNHLLAKSRSAAARPSVLWCYRDKLELSSHRKKREKQVKKMLQRDMLDAETVDPFSLFVESANITYCTYKDSERVLGNTYGMCILQDFEAVTPNLLARTIETVEGGGLVILLLRKMASLTSLYTMVMDVHERFRTESHFKTVARFNERFLLSIALCKACVVMDDELNILPVSSHIRSIQPVSITEDSEGLSEKERELKTLKEQFHDDFPVGPLISRCCTMDQGKAVITFLDAIMDKALRSTVALTAARGRGKSAALGLAIAGAIAAGYSNIFVTAPSPENLKTLFEFVCKGFNALEYKEHLHYDLVKSGDPDLKKATIQINVYKQHRQTIQYLKPHDHEKLSQVELLVIDEAAAIPLPTVKSLLGPHLVFLSSTVSGYEGTGRSLSLKLLQQLESQSQMPKKSVDGTHSGRLFKKIELNESIRYASGDPIESWLHGLLCLDVTSYIPSITSLPHPSKCDLYYVNRDTLFSYHKESEIFLQRMMALYVASHYKNSPNDLQLMADAPSHHLFVLLGPVDESKNQLPDILCVLQVCFEGKISRKSALKSLSEGHQPFGDQIPWKFCEQFQDNVFPSLSGARIVRIAVHPDAMRQRYGSAAVELLTMYYEGKMGHFVEEDVQEIENHEVKVTEVTEKVSLLEENVMPRANLPPLLVNLRERRPEKLHYLGVSFGLTHDLFRFWRKHNFTPFYIGHIPSSVTGEHTCMILKALHNDEIESGELDFLAPFYQDFRQRFSRLLGTTFRMLNYKLAMSIMAPKINFKEQHSSPGSKSERLMSPKDLLSPQDMKRLEAYMRNCVDYHMILDLLPVLAHLYFKEKIPVTLSPLQASILFCMGLQNKEVSQVKEEMNTEREVILSYFIKVMKKFYNYLYNAAAKEIDSTVPRLKEVSLTPHNVSVDEDLNQAAKEVMEKMTAGNDSMLNPENLQQYAIVDRGDGDIEKVVRGAGKVSAGGVVSVKSSRPLINSDQTHKGNSNSKRKGKKDGDRSSYNKKKKSG